MKNLLTLLLVLFSAANVFAETNVATLPDQATVILQPKLAFGEFRTLSNVVLTRKAKVTARFKGLLANRCVDRTLHHDAPCILANDYRELGIVPTEVDLTEDGKLLIKLDLVPIKNAFGATEFSQIDLQLSISNSIATNYFMNFQSEVQNNGVFESAFQVSWLAIEDLKRDEVGLILTSEESR